MKRSTKVQLQSELEHVESSINQHEYHINGLKSELKKTTLNLEILKKHRHAIKNSLGVGQ